MAANEAVIESEISSHQYAKADADLRAVLAAKPDSAKAHYWLGQVLGYEGHAQEALTELARAKAIDPTLAFTNADAFHRVESALQASAAHAAPSTQANSGLGSTLGPSVPTSTAAHVGTASTVQPARHDPQTSNSGFSTMQIFIGVIIVVALFMFFRRRSSNVPPNSVYPPPQGQQPPGYGGGYGYPPGAPPAAGGGLGSVVAGAAGGFILGEMLGHSREAGATTVVHDVVHDSSSSDSNSNYSGNFDSGSSDGGSFGGDSGGGFDSGGGGDF